MAKNAWYWFNRIAPTEEELKRWPEGWFNDPKNWDWEKWEKEWLLPVVSEK